MDERDEVKEAVPKPFNFEAELQRIYADLLSRQEPLGDEFALVWDQNRYKLYES